MKQKSEFANIIIKKVKELINMNKKLKYIRCDNAG